MQGNFPIATMNPNKSGQPLGTMCESNPYPDFDSSRLPIFQSSEHVDRSKLVNKKKILFTAWTIKLHDDNQLEVEGTLECGRRARTKPIIQRIDALQVLCGSNHIYHLVGNMSDSQYELPGFVRHRFHAGFPENWKTVVGIWRSFVGSGCKAPVRFSTLSEGQIVKKKLKLALDKPTNNDCSSESPQKITRIRSESPSTDESGEENCENSGQGRSRSNKDMRESDMEYKSQGDQGFRTMSELKRLKAWTPFVSPDASIEYCLAFRGILLSSMGLPVDKNHRTDAVRRRISARVIETVNQELYELDGDLNNNKRDQTITLKLHLTDVPKELVAWCRHGCPKEIVSFCKNWRMLKSKDNIYHNDSLRGERTIDHDHDQGVAVPTRHEKSTNSIENCMINSIPKRSRPKTERKICTNLPETSEGNEDKAEVGTMKRIGRVADENEEQRSLWRQPTTLSYIYRKSSSNVESILPDGV